MSCDTVFGLVKFLSFLGISYIEAYAQEVKNKSITAWGMAENMQIITL